MGNTSLAVDVEVYAHRPRIEASIKVTQATLTRVAVDAYRRPRPVDNPETFHVLPPPKSIC